MRHSTTVQTAFTAPHQVSGHSICSERHAHHWTIAVTYTAGLDPKKVQLVDHGEFIRALDIVVDEFRNRDLNDMLPGVTTTPEGIALYIHERLVLDWPNITEVTVGIRWREGEIRATVEIPIR